jgi:hypothetical protein
MTEYKKNVVNDFLNSLSGKIVGAVTGLIILFLVAKWEAVVSTFDKGKGIEKQIQFEDNLVKAFKNDSVVLGFLENEKFVKLFFESPTVKKNIEQIGINLRSEIINDVTKNDSNKVSMRSFVGMEAEIRDEQVLPIISEIVKAWNEEKIANKKDIQTIIKKSVKPGSLKPYQF